MSASPCWRSICPRSIVWPVLAVLAWSVPAIAQDPPAHAPATTEGRVIGADKDLGNLRLVRTSPGRAVVQFGVGPLEIVKVGDRLGRNRAEAIEIEAKRLVLDERSTGRDGAPNRARIILRDGERGGTRYYERLDEAAPPARRPLSPANGAAKPIEKPKPKG